MQTAVFHLPSCCIKTVNCKIVRGCGTQIVDGFRGSELEAIQFRGGRSEKETFQRGCILIDFYKSASELPYTDCNFFSYSNWC